MGFMPIGIGLSGLINKSKGVCKMKKVYLLFEVWGDGDSNPTFDFIGVYEDKEDAKDQAKDLFRFYSEDPIIPFRIDEDMRETLTDPAMRITTDRESFRDIVSQASGFLSYGNFGGFAIEETELL